LLDKISPMSIYFSALILIYCSWVLWLYFHWKSIPLRNALKNMDTQHIFITIIIPVRNEAENIQKLLHDIGRQNFPFRQFEAIVVDDSSTDNTPQLVKSRKYAYNLKLLSLDIPDNFSGSHKKLAITQGIQNSEEKPLCQHIIITTDGDCRVDKNWLQAYAEIFSEEKPKLVAGPVTFYQAKTWFEKLQIIEFSSLIGTGAASMQSGSPNMCNGANLAFTKNVFEEVNGYEGNMQQPSGDDEFLMRKVFQFYPEKVTFLKDKRAVVCTFPQKNLVALYQQRRRWAGKWRGHADWKASALAVFIFVFYQSFFAVFLLSLFGLYSVQIFLIQVSIKFCCDWLFLNTVMRFLNKNLSLRWFLLSGILYPVYVVFFGVAANMGRYTWKGRQYA